MTEDVSEWFGKVSASFALGSLQLTRYFVLYRVIWKVPKTSQKQKMWSLWFFSHLWITLLNLAANQQNLEDMRIHNKTPWGGGHPVNAILM